MNAAWRAVAGLAVVLVTAGCGGPPRDTAPDDGGPGRAETPGERYVQAIRGQFVDGGPAADDAEVLEVGESICESLTVEDLLFDGTIAAWNAWRDAAGRDVAEVVWGTSVEHLCPDLGGRFDAVVDLADTIGALP